MEVIASNKQIAEGSRTPAWTVLRLGDACDVITKGTTPTSIGRGFVPTGVKFLKAETISDSGSVIAEKVAFIDDKTHALLKRSQLHDGDVLMSIAGVLGRVGMVRSADLPANTNQALAIVRLAKKGGLTCGFLFHALHSRSVSKQISDISVQAAQANLSLKNVGDFCLLVPPSVDEQERIARALGDTDALIESLEQLLAKKRHLKRGAMQELLTGRKRLPGFTGRWEQRPLVDLCVKIQDGTHFSPEMGGNDFLYVTSKNIRPGKLDVSAAERISAAEHAKIYARCDVVKGDLLLTKDGANTGNAALNTISEPFSLLSSVAMLRFDSRRHVAQYFLYQVLAYEGQQQIAEMMSGNAITRLTLTKIRLLRFPVPSLAEQSAIAEILGDMDQGIDALEAKLTKVRQIKQGMMQELLTGRIRLV